MSGESKAAKISILLTAPFVAGLVFLLWPEVIVVSDTNFECSHFRVGSIITKTRYRPLRLEQGISDVIRLKADVRAIPGQIRLVGITRMSAERALW